MLTCLLVFVFVSPKSRRKLPPNVVDREWAAERPVTVACLPYLHCLSTSVSEQIPLAHLISGAQISDGRTSETTEILHDEPWAWLL